MTCLSTAEIFPLSTQPWTRLRYSTEDFNFPEIVKTAIEESVLERIGHDTGLPVCTRKTDQHTHWHRRFYATFPQWQNVYEQFISEHIANYFQEAFYYQAIPTFRVHLPGNLAVGEFHTDLQYGHPENEVSFWLPLTAAFDTNSIWIETQPGEEDYVPADAMPGDVLAFAATRLRHGNQINRTNITRVSFDFRCLRQCDYSPTTNRSVNSGLAFNPGSYYAAGAIEPRPAASLQMGIR